MSNPDYPADPVHSPLEDLKVGEAELWAEYSWHDDHEHDVPLDEELGGVAAGDIFEIRPCDADDRGGNGFAFFRADDPDGEPLSYEPYHGHDEDFFEQAIMDSMESSEAGGRVLDYLMCRVTGTFLSSCVDGGVPESDPAFHWRIYTCTVDVYQIPREWQPQEH